MRAVTALLPHGLAALSAVVLAVAGFAGGWMVAAAAGLCVLGLAVGWGDLLRLPHKPGTTTLVGALGVAGLVIGTLASDAETRLPEPMAVYAAVIAIAVLTSFAHELLRRDGRANLVESLTGTISGQVIAVLASGWVLLAYTRPGSSAIVVAAAAVAGARLTSGLPLPLPRGAMSWAGVVVGVLAAVGASFAVSGVPPLNAVVVGLTVAGVGVAIDQLFGPAPERLVDFSVLARAAAPVAAAGTVAFAVIRIGIG
jgi:hypothetical protein